MTTAGRLLSRVPLRDVNLQDIADDADMNLRQLQLLYASIHDVAVAILNYERAMMTAIKARVEHGGGQPLDQWVLAFRLVGDGLERDVVMRAGVRLAQESRHAFPERRLEPTRTWDAFLEHLLHRAHVQRQLRADVNIAAEVGQALREGLQVRDELLASQLWSNAPTLFEQVGRRRVEAMRHHRAQVTGFKTDGQPF